MADPGFPIGGVDLVGGRGLPRQLRFVKFVCQNERIGSLGGGGARRVRTLDPPMELMECVQSKFHRIPKWSMTSQ